MPFALSLLAIETVESRVVFPRLITERQQDAELLVVIDEELMLNLTKCSVFSGVVDFIDYDGNSTTIEKVSPFDIRF